MSLSKHVSRATCAEIIHPWNENCLESYRMILRGSFIGSCKVFFPIMIVNCALRVQREKKLDKKIVMDCLIETFQCIFMGTCITPSVIFYNCVIRYLLGKYTLWSLIFVPGFLGALTGSAVQPKRMLQICTGSCNVALESIVKLMSHSGVITLNKYTETLFFMVTNACLMYTAKAFNSKPKFYSWFFKPDNDVPNVDGKLFLETLSKKMRKYFTVGIIIGIVRTLLSDITVLLPRNIHKIFKMSTLKSGIFTSSYVAVYESIIYILNRYFRKDKTVFALPAGLLAGLTYIIDPHLSTNITAFINLIQILYNRVDNRLSKLIPMDKLCFSLSFATIFHILLLYTKSGSKVGYKLIKIATGGKSEMIINTYYKFANNIL